MMVTEPHESGIPVNPSHARIHFPIEGYTAWPQILRLVAIASFVLVMLLSCTLLLLIPEQDMRLDPEKLMVALTCLLVFEMVIVRRLIIPMNGDYGRYRISENRVDFYPLSTLGLRVLTRPQSVPISDFDGVAVQALEAQGNAPAKYAIALIHPQRANMVRVRYVTSRVDAETYARALAESLSLPVIAAVAGR